MGETLPEKQDEEGERQSSAGARILAIGNLHYHGNDLTELRKLSETNPQLAEKVVNQRDKESERDHYSYRFALVSTVSLVALVLLAVTVLFIFVGVWSTIGVIGVILAIALMIRVILTGEWSETTWFGKIVGALVKALGGKAE